MSFSEFNTYQQELGDAKKVKLMYTSGTYICKFITNTHNITFSLFSGLNINNNKAIIIK